MIDNNTAITYVLYYYSRVQHLTPNNLGIVHDVDS